MCGFVGAVWCDVVCSAQFASAKLPIWNSEWSDVYDFSKKKGADGSDGDRNWDLLPANTRLADILKLDVNGLEKEGVTDGAADRTVPATTGRIGGGGVEIAFVAAFQSETAFDLLNKLAADLQSGAVQLTRTRQSKLSKDQSAQLFSSDAAAAAAANQAGMTGVIDRLYVSCTVIDCMLLCCVWIR